MSIVTKFLTPQFYKDKTSEMTAIINASFCLLNKIAII